MLRLAPLFLFSIQKGTNMEEICVREEVNDRLSLYSYKSGLSLGTDTLLLASFLRGGPKIRAAELGTGTGILSLFAAARGKAGSILSFEIQEKYARLAERNIAENRLSNVISVREGDIREALHSSDIGAFDAVFTNPPYFTCESGFRNQSDENYIARHEVYGGICDFAAAASRLLRYGGRFFVVYPAERLCDLVSACRAVALEPKRMTLVHPSHEEPPTLVLLEAYSHGKPGLRMTAPFLIYKDKTHKEETKDMQALHAGSDILSEDR